MSNLIDRQAVLDALGERPVVWSDNDDYTLGARNQYDMDRLAIETAPSAQPSVSKTEIVGDVISRAAVLNLIEQSCCDLEFDCDNVALRKEVEELPSAQTERKKGKWIERNPLNSPDCRLIECSECGNAYIVGYNINYDDWINGRNFCMKCGADLRGGSNGKST